MVIFGDGKNRGELYVRDPKTGEERPNWGLLSDGPIYTFRPKDRTTWLLTYDQMLSVLLYAQVRLWLKKLKKRCCR